MRQILITHTDMDGAGCEVVFRTFNRGNDIQVFSTDYDGVDSIIRYILSTFQPDSCTITMADISPDDRDGLTELVDRGYRVEFYDHHPTSEWVGEIIPNAVMLPDGPESGASLLYRELERRHALRNRRLAEFVDTVRSWDTWEWVSTQRVQAKNLSVLFYMLGYDNFVEIYTDRFIGNQDVPLIPQEHMMFVKARMDSSQRLIDRTTPETVITRRIFGYTAAILFAGSGFSFSDGAYQFLTRYPDYDIMINVDLGRGTLSYRTIRDYIHLGELASRLGGGGHDRSAGSPIPKEAISRILDEVLPGLKPQ